MRVFRELVFGAALTYSFCGYRELSSPESAGIFRELPCRPQLTGETGIRLSLAGAQDKIAVRVDGDTVSRPLDGAPSAHLEAGRRAICRSRFQ